MSALVQPAPGVDDTILFPDGPTIVAVLRGTSDITVTIWNNNLALVLGLQPADIDNIKHDNSDAVDKKRAFFKKWLDKGTASWATLVSALRDPLVDKNVIADKIAKEHPKVGSSPQAWQYIPPEQPQSQAKGIPSIADEDIERAKQEIGRVYTQANHPRGIAFVAGVLDPDGSHKDIREMESAFVEEPLRFAVFRVSDPTCTELAALLKAAAEYEYPITCKFIVFYFAGHGGTDDKGREFVIPRKLKGDSDILMIDHNILGPFRSRNDDPIPLKSGERRPCLFFFDCCLSQADIVHPSKNFFDLRDPPRHSIVAYATSPGLKSQGNKTEGGLWTRYLSKNLKKENEPLTKILTDTHGQVSNELQDRKEKFRQGCDKTQLDVLEKLTKLVEEKQYEILDEELTKLHGQRSGKFVNSFLSAYVPQVPHFLDSSLDTIYLNEQTNAKT